MERWRRFSAGLTVVAFVLLGAAGPATADPVTPTDYRARVLSIRPTPPAGVRLTILGGDAFVQLHVPRGHTAVVPDYSSDAANGPYLRFEADGTVRRNEHAAATALNRSRSGPTTDVVPDGRGPRWVVVATDGTFAWHDHRTHLMGVTDVVIAPDGRVDMGGPDGTWAIPLEIDGRSTTVTGELVRLEPPAPWRWWGLVVVAGLVLAALARRWRPVDGRPVATPVAVAAAAVGAIAVVVAVGARAGLPTEAAPPVLTVAIPAVGLVAALVLLALGGRRPAVARVAAAAAAATLGAWAWLRRDVLTAAIVPTEVGAPLDRAVTAAALAVAVVLAVVLALGPAASARAAPPGRQQETR